MNAEASRSLVVIDTAPASPKLLQQQVNAIQQAMEQVMKEGVHYGTIPGCGPKPTLLKPGAEKVGLLFRLLPFFDPVREDLPNGHREITVTCTLKDPNGIPVGQGVGSCSTMEKKYRYRKDRQGRQIENPDLADTYNTVLKIAKKRAHVDAILTTTAASDIFTQDIEDMGGAEYTNGAPVPDKVKAHVKTADELPPPHPGYDEPNIDGSDIGNDTGNDVIAYRVPYDMKDHYKPTLKDHGHRWDAAAKCWTGGTVIPELEALRVRA